MNIKKFLIGAAMVLLAASTAACSNNKSASSLEAWTLGTN